MSLGTVTLSLLWAWHVGPLDTTTHNQISD